MTTERYSNAAQRAKANFFDPMGRTPPAPSPEFPKTEIVTIARSDKRPAVQIGTGGEVVQYASDALTIGFLTSDIDKAGPVYFASMTVFDQSPVSVGTFHSRGSALRAIEASYRRARGQ